MHAAIRSVLAAERGSLIVSATVTAEVDYLIRRRGGPPAARRFLYDLAQGALTVESMTRAEHAIALALDTQYAGLNLGIADLSVIVLAHRFGTRRLLTFDDRHFRAVRTLSGEPFTLLPADR